MPVEMDIASEYRYRNPVVGPGDLVIGITQSGETADTLAAMRLARDAGAGVLAVTNIMGSQATRDADAVLYTRAGLEIGVAATKTFLAQVAAMYLLGLRIAELRETLPPARIAELVAELKALPSKIEDDARADRGAGPRRRRRPQRPGVLPLPRPPHRPAGLPRGCAEAEGDLLHPDRRLRRGRDEARPDRPARRVDPGRLRRHRQPGSGEGPLQRRRGPRPRRRRRSRSPPPATTAPPKSPTRRSRSPAPTGSCSRSSRSCRCSCSPTTSPAPAASTSTSRATWRRRSPSSERQLRCAAHDQAPLS